MYTFRQFGRNDLKLFWIFARKRAKFSSAFRSNCLWRCQNKGCGLFPMYLPRNTACVWDIEASEYSEEFQKRHVPLLLSSGVALILALCSERSKDKQLFRAAKYGNAEEIESLSAGGVDVNIRHRLGWTALQVAAVNKNVEAVRALLKAGADPNLGDEFKGAHRTGIEMGLHAVDGNK